MTKSTVTYIVSVLVMLYASLFFCPRWQRFGGESTFGWDVSGYYWYLPSTVIYKDLKGQNFGDSIIRKYQFTPSFDQGFRTENGGFVLTYSSGMALLYSPFFVIAHVVAEPMGYPADGFSKPYQFAISLGSLLVCFLGLWYYRKLLLYYYSDGVTAIMILLLALGTNYLNYTAIDGALTHNWLFTLYVFLLLATRSFYKEARLRYALAIGLLCGLLTLVRPSEIICILLPLLWGLERVSLTAFKDLVAYFRKQFPKLSIAAICMIAVGAIQLFYWKYVSGHWLVYSYAEKGFSWKHPHFYNYTLSYRSGWLTYTPLMILSFIGIIPFLRNGSNKVAVLTFFAINYYIVSAWDIWWYGGTGGRAMIQSYPVILFPFASLIAYLSQRRVWTLIATPFIVLAVYFNIWFTIQAHGGESLYDSESMTQAYYWKVAGRWHVPDDVKKLKDTDELFEGEAKDMKLVYENNLEADSSLAALPQAIEGSRSIQLSKQNAWSAKYRFALAENQHSWIRAEASFRISSKEWTPWLMTQFIVGFSKNGNVIKERMIRVQRFLNDGETKNLSFDITIPDERPDSCHIHFWNVESNHEIYIDQLKAWTFED